MWSKQLILYIENSNAPNNESCFNELFWIIINVIHRFVNMYTLVQHVDSPTHSADGLLDVVNTRSDCNIGNLCVVPPTISDHGLAGSATCTVPYACLASPVFTFRRVRGWKRLDRVAFLNALSSGPLCRDEDYYVGMSAKELFDITFKESSRLSIG